MRGLTITSKGIEETASTEIEELLNTECLKEECCVSFNFENFEDLCLLCYKSQSINRVLYLFDCFEFNDFFNDFEKFIEKIELKDWLSRHKNFKTECIRIGSHAFNSVDVEVKTRELILKYYRNEKIRYDSKAYNIIFFVYIVNKKCYFGIDFSGFELNKRGYKIFLHADSLRGTIAYALLRECGFDKKELLLDPFSRDGVVAIEAAFYSCDFPHNYYRKDKFAFLKLDLGADYEIFFGKIDKKIKKSKTKIYSFDYMFKYVDYSRKNAKIAGVDKQINFSRTELEWLDIKFKKGIVDKIATNPPKSKNANLEKIYNEFFYQAEYILKKNGRIAMISTIQDFVKKHASNHNFIVEKEKEVWSGENKLTILVFKKKNI